MYLIKKLYCYLKFFVHSYNIHYNTMIFREADIVCNEKDSIGHKMVVAGLIARKMSQKYIDNLLYPSSLFLIWLNNGFIMFFQTYIIDKVILFLIETNTPLKQLIIYV